MYARMHVCTYVPQTRIRLKRSFKNFPRFYPQRTFDIRIINECQEIIKHWIIYTYLCITPKFIIFISQLFHYKIIVHVIQAFYKVSCYN